MVGLFANKVWANCCQSHCKVARSHCASPTLPELQRSTIMRNKVPKVPISWKSRVHLFWQATNKISFATTWQHGWGTASKAQARLARYHTMHWASLWYHPVKMNFVRKLAWNSWNLQFCSFEKESLTRFIDSKKLALKTTSKDQANPPKWCSSVCRYAGIEWGRKPNLRFWSFFAFTSTFVVLPFPMFVDVSSFPWIFCGFPVFLWFSLILCFFCQVSATRLLFDVLQFCKFT